MEALQVLKYHVQQTDPLNFTEETSERDEKAEIEKEMLNAETLPDDLQGALDA